ncbi:hypothetical protein HYZ80_03260 [Candidatus Parcubacteria bacterium]|nr:hypothetical protein [Candidatus Parcubacteria bacterium]
MITERDLSEALGNAEVGKRLRLTFYDARAENAALSLRSVVALNSADVIRFEDWTAPVAVLCAAREGVWDRGKRTFFVTIGPELPSFGRTQFEMIMLGCLEKIEAVA